MCLCLCGRVCVCDTRVYTYISTYYTHTHMHTYVRTYVHTCVPRIRTKLSLPHLPRLAHAGEGGKRIKLKAPLHLLTQHARSSMDHTRRAVTLGMGALGSVPGDYLAMLVVVPFMFALPGQEKIGIPAIFPVSQDCRATHADSLARPPPPQADTASTQQCKQD